MTWLLGSICASTGLIVGIVVGLLLMYGIITKTLGKEGRKNLEDAEKKHREFLESAATGHEIMRENGVAITKIAKAIASASRPNEPLSFATRLSGLHGSTEEGMVLLPRALTAENGAKGLLIGEFFEECEFTCPQCGGEGGLCERDEGEGPCESCNDERVLVSRVTVSWPTIKAIYAKIVEHYGK